MTTRNNRADFFKKKLPQYRKSAVLFAEEVLRFTPDEWQKDVLNDLSDSNRVTVRSGQGVGKTGVEAIAALWLLWPTVICRLLNCAPGDSPALNTKEVKI